MADIKEFGHVDPLPAPKKPVKVKGWGARVYEAPAVEYDTKVITPAETKDEEVEEVTETKPAWNRNDRSSR